MTKDIKEEFLDMFQEIFSIEDVINVMIELETCGNEHYLSLSKQTQSEELKNLFLNLANAEQKHKLRYENFKKETPEDFRVKLKDNVLETKFGKALGVKSFSFILYNNLGLDGMSIYLTQKKLNKLFGK